MRYLRHILMVLLTFLLICHQANNLLGNNCGNNSIGVVGQRDIVVYEKNCDCNNLDLLITMIKHENKNYDYVLDNGNTILETICCCDFSDAFVEVIKNGKGRLKDNCDLLFKSWIFSLFYDSKNVIQALNDTKLVNCVWSECYHQFRLMFIDTTDYKQSFLLKHEFSKISRKNIGNSLFIALLSEGHSLFDKIYPLCLTSVRGRNILKSPEMQVLSVSSLDTAIINRMLIHSQGESEYQGYSLTGSAISSLLLSTTFKGFNEDLPSFPDVKSQEIFSLLVNKMVNISYWGKDAGKLVEMTIMSPSVLLSLFENNLNINSLVDGKNTFIDLLLDCVRERRSIKLNSYEIYDDDVVAEFDYKFKILDLLVSYKKIDNDKLDSIYVNLMEDAIKENNNLLALELLRQRGDRLRLEANRARFIELAKKNNNARLIVELEQ